MDTQREKEAHQLMVELRKKELAKSEQDKAHKHADEIHRVNLEIKRLEAEEKERENREKQLHDAFVEGQLNFHQQQLKKDLEAKKKLRLETEEAFQKRNDFLQKYQKIINSLPSIQLQDENYLSLRESIINKVDRLKETTTLYEINTILGVVEPMLDQIYTQDLKS